MNNLRTHGAWFLFLFIWGFSAPEARAADFEHGKPVEFVAPETGIRLPKAGDDVGANGAGDLVFGQVSGFSIDPASRNDVVALYHCIYEASEGFEDRMGWVGNIANCQEGTVSSDFHDDTLRRINFYRALVGLNTDITFDSVKNAKCQEAALMMARNNALDHDPPTTWSCWTADGDEAAGKSNLSRGTYQDYTGPRAVDGQVRDNGSSNVPVGHRRWLLYPRSVEMGNGGIPWISGYSAASAVWVIGDFGPRPASPAWVAWPNAGFTPYDLVPARWSFSMYGANFDSASVSMTHNGAPVSVVKIHPTASSPAAGYGDPAIVWEPIGLPSGAPAEDRTYTVTISGIVGGAASTVSYEVTVMDPAVLTQEPVIAGPANPPAFLDTPYAFDTVDGADSYHLRIRTMAETVWTEGAEDTPAPRVIDLTDVDYDLRQSAVVRTGGKAFHLTFPFMTPETQLFEIDRTILPSTESLLSFAYLRRFSSTDSEIRAEVSTDDGLTWSPVWAVNGICGGNCSSGDWDDSFLSVSVSLAAFAEAPLRLRFILETDGGYYGGSDDRYGVFIDDVTVTDAQEQVAVQETDLPGDASSFALHPDGAASYLMDMYVEMGCTTFPYGPITAVDAWPRVWISSASLQGGQMVFGYDVTGGTFSACALYSAGAPGGVWSADSQAQHDAPAQRFTTPAGPGRLYRIEATWP